MKTDNSILYICRECMEQDRTEPFSTYWSAQEFAAKGGPVCPFDGDDMVTMAEIKNQK